MVEYIPWMMGPGSMMGNYYFGLGGLLSLLFVLGIVVLVWLWVIKLWKELYGKKRNK